MHAHVLGPVLAAHVPAHASMPSTELPAGKRKTAAAKHNPLLRAPEAKDKDRPAHKAEGHHLTPEAAPAAPRRLLGLPSTSRPLLAVQEYHPRSGTPMNCAPT